MRLIRLALPLLALAGAAVACQPAPATTGPPPCNPVAIPVDGTMPCGVDAPAPDATGVVVIGDSITWGAAMAVHADRPIYAYPGWHMGHALPYLRQLAIDHPDARPVIALGTNDANPTWNRGWDSADEALWAEALALFPQASVVLPEIGQGPGQLPNDDHVAEAAKARAWITAATTRTVPWPQAHDPAVTGIDAIHLAAAAEPEAGNLSGVEPSAARARYAVIEQAAML